MTTTTVSVRAAAAVFSVSDVGKSVAHYRDALGFQVEFTYGEPLAYAGVERGGAAIQLQAAVRRGVVGLVTAPSTRYSRASQPAVASTSPITRPSSSTVNGLMRKGRPV